MRCDRVRRVLLAAERPEPPPLEVRPHLSDCADCRTWLRHLGTLEHRLRYLPVPPSPGKERVLRQLREGFADRPPLPAEMKDRGRRKLAVAMALAAAVAAFAIGLWLWPTHEPAMQFRSVPDPIAAIRREYRDGMATATTPAQQVNFLAGFGESIQKDAVNEANYVDSSRLEALAAFYDEIIRGKLVGLVGQIPPDERAAIVGQVRGSLGKTESDMSRIASGLGTASSAEHLRRIASSAREADSRLRAMVKPA